MADRPVYQRAPPVCEATDGPARLPAASAVRPAVINTVSAFFYQQPVQNLIKDYKFRGRLDIGAGLADELARRTSSHPIPDALVPVPLHPRRLRQRGFNQATEIARRLSLQHKIPILINNITRTHWSAPQTGLSRRERQQNVAQVFAVNRPIPAHIAIVDDVVTSGATSMALMRALHQAGGSRFQLWVLACAVIPGEDAR